MGAMFHFHLPPSISLAAREGHEMAYDLSVVVCTYDRYEILEQALAVLFNSRGFAATSCEILIVENTKPGRRQPIVVPSAPNIRVMLCEQTGLSHARNFGITHTTGEVIAFLDDDALVCDDWCKEIERTFAQHPEVMAVGGKVIPLFSVEQLPSWYDDRLVRYLSCIDWGKNPRYLHPGEWIVGANMAFRRKIFQEYGMFEIFLGRKGTSSLLSNEEITLLERIGIQSVFYAPSACVQHMIPTDRLTTKWFRRRSYWQAVSDMVAGRVNTDDPALRKEYGHVIGQLEAERRNLNALSFEPTSYTEFALQLRGVYLAAAILGDGGV
jgi:glucosyl-dolichyl phosphate glucuronosyltransferase